MADSLAHLDKKKQMGIEEVTAIRTEADFRENRRRIKVIGTPRRWEFTNTGFRIYGSSLREGTGWCGTCAEKTISGPALAPTG